MIRNFFRNMFKVGDSEVIATEVIPSQTNITKLEGKIHSNTDFESLYGFGEELKTDLIFLPEKDKDGDVSIEPDQKTKLLLDKIKETRPNLPPVSFKCFKEIHKILVFSEKNGQFNCEISVESTGKKVEVYLKSTREIEPEEKIILKFSRENWLRHQLLLTGDPFHKLLLLIFLESFNKPESLPPKFEAFENFFIKWKTWSEENCQDFLRRILKAELTAQFLEGLNCQGLSFKTVLYRMLQVRVLSVNASFH